MDVNQVRFGNYSLGASHSRTSSNNNEVASETQTQNQPKPALHSSNDQGVIDALGIAGMQNLAFISKAGLQDVNPADYLSEERMKDIEAMMAGFEIGVAQAAQTIEEEFPGMFAPDQLNALAAQVFAAE